MSRLKTRTSQFLIDISVLMLAFVLAMLVRFDWSVPQGIFRQLVIVLPYVVLLQYAFPNHLSIFRLWFAKYFLFQNTMQHLLHYCFR